MPRMMGVPEAARRVRVSEKTIREAITQRELAAEKIGPAWAINPADLADWEETFLEEDDATEASDLDEETDDDLDEQ